jgi:membrane protease YdiL (CAAX protease family)
MTGIALPARPVARWGLLSLALAAIVIARWAAALRLVADPILVGLGFGACLLALGIAGGAKAGLPRARALPIGLAGGAVLVIVALVARGGSPLSTFPTGVPFLPWALATVLVAVGEEAVLRGVLFDALDEHRGAIVAILGTSVAFALIHVPVYGWHVVPLDFGVGMWLAGLRLLAGGIGAPAAAHALADLATYWL